MRASAASTQSTIAPIQWLRGIAALMVVFHHANEHADLMRVAAGIGKQHFLGFSNWWFGVHIFFVISGFIMIHATRNFGTPGAGRVFLTRRLIRVVPLYWLVTAIAAAVLFAAPQSIPIVGDRVTYVVKSLLFIPVLREPGDLRPLVGQGWTLNYEVFFYAAFALATLLSRRAGIAALTIGFAVLVALGRFVDATSPILFTWTDSLLLEFLFGVYVGLAFERGWRMPAWAGWASVGAGAAAIILNVQGPAPLAIGLPAAMIVAGFVLRPPLHETAWTAPLSALGDASYSLYLTHTLIMRPVRLAWTALFGASVPVAAYILVVAVLSIVLAMLSFRYVEARMTAAMMRRFRA